MGSNSVANPLGHNFLGTGSSNFGRGVTDAFTGGLAEVARPDPFGFSGTTGRLIKDGLTGGLTEFTQSNPFGLPIHNPLGGLFGNHGGGLGGSGAISGPFSLDQNQFDADRAAIAAAGVAAQTGQESLAKSNYDRTTGMIPQVVASQLKSEMPDIAESANAGHVLDSSAYGQEIARRQSELQNSLLIPATQQYNQDLGRAQLTGQGYAGQGLQRGLSLEDFINQANVAKTIGAQMAPQPPTSKQNFGTAASGIGAIGQGIGAMAK